uniref:Surface antigen n=1 Tax=Candidatus Kentrum sp. FM TaxID=2126340 RepID=A0A450SRD8_9GAMM|nr:MAG: Surface antigen [Candidatus Kentron sp. FM]VFJ56491.1 MAG: Surface antigen [Candidatus Kentron sp. FM]VFK08299.1 MAG: Surface antigen [Candidatus Kentron sp. FM]
MWNKILISTFLATGLALSGCNMDGPTNEQTGMVLGGVIGGVAGNQVGGGSGRTVATVIGALAGAYIGGKIGHSMDETDRLRAEQALEETPTGTTSSWHNPDTGDQYAVTPTNTYYAADTGRPCREYALDATIGGSEEKVYGTACRTPDGYWETVN